MSPALRLVRSAPVRTQTGRAQSRRREVARRLGELEASLPPRRSDEIRPDSDVFALQLSRTLHALGPIFGGFGLYLASRPDLLPARACLELAAAPAPSALAVTVLERELEQALGARAGELRELEPEPCARDVFSQSHRARLEDGRRVRVRVLRPGLAESAELDAELLELTAPALVELGAPAAEALAGYRKVLAEQLDLGRLAAELELLGHRLAESDLLTIPARFGALSARTVLTLEDVSGHPLAPGGGASHDHELARQLCLVWLEQALVIGRVAIEAEVLEQGDGKLAFVGGSFAELPIPAQANLWAYVQATAAFHPDRAGSCLLREIEALPGASERDFHLRLRQVVPFRDGSWSARGDQLAEHLVLHWRIVRESGYRPKPHLEAFYRGLFWLSRTSHALAPRTDSLRHAQEELRWLAAWTQFRQVIDPRQMAAMVENNLAGLLELPQKIDRLLHLVEGDGQALRVRLEDAEPHAERRRRNRRTAAMALGVVMMALALVAPRLAELGLRPGWLEPLGAVLFLVIGALLLRATVGKR